MSAAMNVPYPISLGHIAQGFEITVAPKEMQYDLSLTALINGVPTDFKPFDRQGMRLDQQDFVEGTNELMVLAVLKPGAQAKHAVLEVKDVATQSVDQFIMTPTHDGPEFVEVLVER